MLYYAVFIYFFHTIQVVHSQVTVKKILKIWAPLMAFRLCQRVLRPLINLFVARDDSSGYTQDQATKVSIVSV